MTSWQPELINDAYFERRLIDVVIRHQLDRIDLTPSDFADGRCASHWNAITRIWARGDRPDIHALVDELAIDTSGTTRRYDAAELLCLPNGYLDDVDDYVAFITDNARRRRTALLLADAATALHRGGDTDAVLQRLQELMK